MPRTLKGESDPVRLRFGGGLNSRGSEEDIDPRECASGENFALDTGNLQLRPRKPFDLVGTLPNAGTVKGAATLLKSDGTVSTLIQGDGNVYEWTAGPTFTLVGTVDSNAKIRGRIEHISQLDDIVVITDLALTDTVKQWDGTTFSTITFTDENAAAFGTFKAKYAYVAQEQLVFANIHDNGTDFQHLIVGAKRGTYTQITTTDRPSSSISVGDPFFLVQPDLYAINGIVEQFGKVIISSNQGSLYRMTGSSSQDYAMDELASLSAAAGDEAIVRTPADVLYGRQGKVESVTATERFGDVEANDLSFWIADEIEDFGDWLVVYNKRLDRTYFHPVGQSRVYVFHHGMFQLMKGELSPWAKWTTQHAMAFNPTLMMPVFSPIDKLEYVLMGDASGNVYTMEGTASGGDGGSASVKSFRESALLSAAAEGKVRDIQGYLRYRKNKAVSVELTVKFAGEHKISEAVTIPLPAATFDPVYGSTAYYGTTEFYGTEQDSLRRQRWTVPASSNDLQIRVEVDDTDEYVVNEIGFRYSETN